MYALKQQRQAINKEATLRQQHVKDQITLILRKYPGANEKQSKLKLTNELKQIIEQKDEDDEDELDFETYKQ